MNSPHPFVSRNPGGNEEQERQAEAAQVQRQKAYQDAVNLASQTAARQIQDLDTYYGMDQPAYREMVKQELAANPMITDVYPAYLAVLHREILPRLNQSQQAAVMADLNKKANASGVSPGSGSSTLPDRPKSFEEALEQAGFEA